MRKPLIVRTSNQNQPVMFAKNEREKVQAWRTMELARNRWERATYHELRQAFGMQRKLIMESPDINSYYVDSAIAETSERFEDVIIGGGIGISREVYPMVASQLEKATSDYDRWIARWLRNYSADAVVGINQTTRDSIRSILDESATERWSIGKTAQSIDRLYLQQIIPNRSFVIARTEISGASNMSSQYAMETIAVEVQKVWTTARDTAVRDTHQMMEGVTVDQNEYFTVDMPDGGTENMLVPADPTASAGNRINCRCIQVYQKS